MNHHQEAWEHVQNQILGTEVCEVTSKPNWGFQQDDPSILNLTTDEFLTYNMEMDTIILHILFGEGVPREKVIKCILHATACATKVIVLDHNWNTWNELPRHSDVFSKFPYHYEEWGRNHLYCWLTLDHLMLPQLSNTYLQKHLNEAFVTKDDEGIDKNYLVYTHTSESPITFDLPTRVIYWVIGGGLCYEHMRPEDTNVLFDSCLRQVLYCAWRFDSSPEKLERIWSALSRIKVDPNYKHWRVPCPNGTKPSIIKHCAIEDLDPLWATVYVSTISKKRWQHLLRSNHVIEARTNRDVPQLRSPGETV